MNNAFDLSADYLRGRRNSKWARYDGGVIPSWIAEMDFSVAPAIQKAIDSVTNVQDYGYPKRKFAPAETDVAHAFVRRMEKLYGWQIAADQIVAVTDLIQAQMGAILAFTEPGDGVIVQTPCYPPFKQAVADAGRRMIDNPLVDDGTKFVIDFDGLEKIVDEKTKLWVLCNPQNPTGRVFTREELETIGRFCIKRGIVLFSDEIHSDLVFDHHVHIPIASLSPEIAALTVTANSPTKSFNIPGLRCGVMHFGSDDLKKRFLKRLPKQMLGKPSIVGIDATIAAWDLSDDWLKDVHAHLLQSRNLTMSFIRQTMPEFKVYTPDATYLAWIECTGIPEPAADYFLEKAKIAFSPGETFSPDCGRFVRLNFATSGTLLQELLDRMAKAAKELR